MNPTYFSSPKALGEVLAERFYVDIRDQKEGLIILADAKQLASDQSVWEHFIVKLKSLGIHFDSQMVLSKGSGYRTQLNTIRQNKGRKVLFIPSEEEIRSLVNPSDLIFWTTDYTHLKSKNDLPKLSCDYKSIEVSFKCLSERVRFSFYRKRLKENKYSAMVQKLLDNKYMVYIYEPQN